MKYMLLFQNKLNSRPGLHIPVSVMFGRSPPPPLDGMFWTQNSISGHLLLSLTTLRSAFIIGFTVVIYVSLNSVLLLRNVATFFESAFSLTCLFIIYLCRYQFLVTGKKKCFCTTNSISLLCIFPSSRLYFCRSFSKNNLPQEIRQVCRHKCVWWCFLIGAEVKLYNTSEIWIWCSYVNRIE